MVITAYYYLNTIVYLVLTRRGITYSDTYYLLHEIKRSLYQLEQSPVEGQDGKECVYDTL